MSLPEHTLCNRICTLLASVAPLTPKQLGVALDYPHAASLLGYLQEAGRVQRVSATSRQRQESGGRGSAYALAGSR